MIGPCLASLVGQVDEIIVLDTGSTDYTREMAASYGAKVVQSDWNDNFSDMRNISLQYAKSEYIFVIDADERAPENARERMKWFTQHFPDALGRVRIRSPWRDNSGEIQTVTSHSTRFFPRSSEIFYSGVIHEQVMDASDRRQRCDINMTLWHQGYELSTTKMIEKTKRNIVLLKSGLREQPENGYYWYQLGKSYEALKEWGRAAECYEAGLVFGDAAASYYPELLIAYLYNAKASMDQDKVWSLLKYALERYPDLPDLYFLAGKALIDFSISNLDLIRKSFETCILLGEKGEKYTTVEGVGSYLAMYNLGVFYESQADWDRALEMYRQAVSYGYKRANNAAERILSFQRAQMS